MRSLTSFQLKGRLTKTGSSVEISNDILTGDVVSFTDETVLGSSDDNSTKELMVASASGGTLTISQRGLDQSETKTTDTDLQKEFRSGTIFRVVASASDIPDLDSENTFSGNNTFSGQDTFNDITLSGDTTTAGLTLKSLTTTQRDALTPAEGMIIKNSTTGVLNQYIGGAWADFATGSTPNASTIVAGKGEVADDSELSTPSSDTGGTGAFLWAKISQLVKLLGFAPTLTSSAEDDLYAFSDISDSTKTKTITKANLRNDLAGSKTLKGTFEMLTDTEAETGTDEERVPNIKQIEDNYNNIFVVASDNLKFSGDTEKNGSTDSAFQKQKEVLLYKTGVIRVSFDLKSSVDLQEVEGQLYKNGSAIGTLRTTTSSSYTTYTEDISFRFGDLIQLYTRDASGTSAYPISRNFRIKFDKDIGNTNFGYVNLN